MTQHLSDQPQTEHPVNVPAFSGAILGLQGDVLHGWAIDNRYPDQRPAVEVFIDEASVALVRADQYEPNAPAGDQYNGFSVQLRQHWIDGARSITAKIANQSFMLEGQLSLPTAPSEDSASVASQVWHTGGLRIGGWCWDPKATNRHVEVTVRGEDGRVISQALCNEHNQALAYRTTSDHGFAIDLPWELADGKVHVLDIFNDLGEPLSGSPIRLCCWPQGIEGLVRQLNPAHDLAVTELLLSVAKEQNMRLPKSAGWKNYPEWFIAFQKLDKNKSPTLKGKIGILLISEGNTCSEQYSLSSLNTNHKDIHKVTVANFENLAPALEVLILAECDRILPIFAGDKLADYALPYFSSTLDQGSAWAFTDCDRDDAHGNRSFPWLKPMWDIDLFIAADIFTPGSIFSTPTVQKALTLLSERKLVNWYDLTAGIALTTQRENSTVSHLPRILYHRAQHSPSSPEKAEPSLLRMRAMQWLCEKLSPGTKVEKLPLYPSILRALWPLPQTLPLVSIIIPTRDQYKLLQACIEGLLENTDYPNLEIIVVDNQSSTPETLAYFENIKARGVIILEHPHPFNYSTINNRAVEITHGELVCLLNNDIEIIERNWLREMVAQLYRPNTGVVGAKLLWPNRMVQHGGVVVGINGLAAHIGNNLKEEDAGYLALNQISHRQGAVTAACLLLRKETFVKVGGLDENAFPVAFNDVDLCLRIQKLGLHVIWAASAKLIHAESASRGKDTNKEKQARAQREQANFIHRWVYSEIYENYYNPSLSLDYLSGPYGGLALPPLDLKLRSSIFLPVEIHD